MEDNSFINNERITIFVMVETTYNNTVECDYDRGDMPSTKNIQSAIQSALYIFLKLFVITTYFDDFFF